MHGWAQTRRSFVTSFMRISSNMTYDRAIVERWCILSEQRLNYLTDLFETDRWSRYHSWIAFLENIQEANSAVETWRNLLAEVSADNRPIDASWLDRPKAVPPRREAILYDLAPKRTLGCTPQLSEMPADQPSLDRRAEQHSQDASLDGALLDEALAAALPADNVREPGLVAVVLDRYPLLRNAF